MARPTLLSGRAWVVGLFLYLALAWLAAPQPGHAQSELTQPEPPAPGDAGYCLSCHSNPDLSMTLPGGETLSLFVSPEDLDHSVHSELGIACQACHPDIHTYPHPPTPYTTRAELSAGYSQACERCHTGFPATPDSIHHEAAAGEQPAPACASCHTAHRVRPPEEQRAQMAETCGGCHTDVFEQFQNSVHGAALLETGNPDVPACSDCHGVHAEPLALGEPFRVAEPGLCAGCHADPELMARYDLAADVYNSYTTSWHGVDVEVFQARWPNLWHTSAVCSDCHGEHDILPASHPASHVHPNNLLATCQQCHPAAGPNWTSAWIGHYQNSLEQSPFVYYTQVFYNSFAYGILWLSAIYVLLQIIRLTVARIRRSL